MIILASREEKELLQRLRTLDSHDATAMTAEVIGLKREVAELTIAKSQLEEEFSRKERELRHMIGLEKQRQEAERVQARIETEQATKDAMLSVREENLKAERQRFEEQLEFNTKRFESMEKYLKDMMGDILNRLPNVSMEIQRRERVEKTTRGR